jgi:hypothetical protein
MVNYGVKGSEVVESLINLIILHGCIRAEKG